MLDSLSRCSAKSHLAHTELQRCAHISLVWLTGHLLLCVFSIRWGADGCLSLCTHNYVHWVDEANVFPLAHFLILTLPVKSSCSLSAKLISRLPSCLELCLSSLPSIITVCIRVSQQCLIRSTYRWLLNTCIFCRKLGVAEVSRCVPSLAPQIGEADQEHGGSSRGRLERMWALYSFNNIKQDKYWTKQAFSALKGHAYIKYLVIITMSSTNRKVSVSRVLRGFPQLLCRDVPARERRHRIKGCKHRQKLPWWLCDNLSAMQETQVQFLGQEDPLEEGTATHSSILAWRIP